jgi:sulfate adenylyltransferase large subunit
MAILESPVIVVGASAPGSENQGPGQHELIEELLAAERSKDLLRFSTAGSVDDGKSTLIGRLLYDSRSVYDDHVQSVTRNAAIDFAQLTDGLRAEREQGITIDVAYRYFSTPKRKFIIADTPGHEQYTRNMATGASTADVAIVLVDARKGILDQTRRHACIASLLGIPLVIAAVNKMDLVGFSEEVFLQHRRDLEALGRQLEIPELIAIPVSALDGDNVVHRSSRIPWYSGPSLLELLETVPLAIDRAASEKGAGFRMAVQRVIRPHQDFRGFAGQIAAGMVRPGDEVIALPSGIRTRVRTITTWEGDLDSARAPQSVTLTLEDEADISRGDMIAAADAHPRPATRLEATVVWMQTKPLRAGATYLLKHTTQTVRATVVEIQSRIDVEQLEQRPAEQLELNAIGQVVLETSRPLLADLYRENRVTGSFILIDPADNATAGAGMVRAARATALRVAEHGAVVELGGDSDVVRELERQLLDAGAVVVRTRVADRGRLIPLAQAGAVVLMEGGVGEALHLTVVDHGATVRRELAGLGSVDEIVEELRRASVLDTNSLKEGI